MIKNKFVTGISLLLVLSLTACQPAVSRQEVSTENSAASEQENPDTSDESSQETAYGEKDLVYTGIQAKITEHNAEYSGYSELKDYLDEKQFAILGTVHEENDVLIDGTEALDSMEDKDWDLVRPLHNISDYDCGYCKTDYNNDGTSEIIYRKILRGKIAATVYEPDSESKKIESKYNLVDIFQDIVLPDSKLQQLWFKKIGGDIVTFCLLRKNNSVEFILYSDIVTVKDAETMCVRLETRNLTVTTKHTDNLEQDIFQNRILDLTKGEGEAFEELRCKQLSAYQKKRQISSAFKTTKLPEGLLKIFKEDLAGEQSYDSRWGKERVSAYEDKKHQLTLEQVRTYLGEAFPDYYDEESVSCAYLVDLDKNGSEELVLFCDSGGTAGFADVDIWQKQKDKTAEQLYNIPELRSYAALLDYDGTYYFVVRQYNFYTRETDGFHIFTAGENGTLQQYLIGLENKDNQKSWIETFRGKELDTSLEQNLTNYMEKIKREVEEKTVPYDGYQLIYGNAETPCQESGITCPLEAFSVSSHDEQSCRVVDFDNDGRMECVEKTIWYPSSLSSELGLMLDFYKEYDSYVHYTEVHFPCFFNLDSTHSDFDSFGTPVHSEEMFEKCPIQLWFEELDQKVYTFYLYRIEGSSDYLLEVSLIEGEKLHPLLQYLLIAEKEYTFEQIKL